MAFASGVPSRLSGRGGKGLKMISL